jgi:hypothetical protein
MRIAMAVPVLLLPLVASRMPPTPAPRAEGFSIIVTATANGWAVDCERGCSWKASFTCDKWCPALVDSRGVVTMGEIRPPDPAFQFILRGDEKGVQAVAKSGTYWTSLAWSCAAQPCRARITREGVTPDVR